MNYRQRCSSHAARIARQFVSFSAVVLLVQSSASAQQPQTPAEVEMPSLWNLAIQGGWFMIPIGVASIITLAFTLERLAGLRRGRILPKEVISKLREIMSDASPDPRKVWDAAGQRHSPLANLLKAAVLKSGRPQPELEKSVEDAVQREVAAMTRNLRPINVVASISPLLGLLGTVQGMIMAFMVTSTTSSTGTAKAQELAHGIYTALVTTFAGLCVAVVSLVLANFLEGRIERLLRQMEAIFLDLLPKLGSWENKIRVTEISDGEEAGIKVQPLSASVATQRALTPGSAPVPATAAAQTKETPKTTRRIQTAKKPRSAKPVRVAATSVRREEQSPPEDEFAAKKNNEVSTLRSNFDR